MVYIKKLVIEYLSKTGTKSVFNSDRERCGQKKKPQKGVKGSVEEHLPSMHRLGFQPQYLGWGLNPDVILVLRKLMQMSVEASPTVT